MNIARGQVWKNQKNGTEVKITSAGSNQVTFYEVNESSYHQPRTLTKEVFLKTFKKKTGLSFKSIWNAFTKVFSAKKKITPGQIWVEDSTDREVKVTKIVDDMIYYRFEGSITGHAHNDDRKIFLKKFALVREKNG